MKAIKLFTVLTFIIKRRRVKGKQRKEKKKIEITNILTAAMFLV